MSLLHAAFAERFVMPLMEQGCRLSDGTERNSSGTGGILFEMQSSMNSTIRVRKSLSSESAQSRIWSQFNAPCNHTIIWQCKVPRPCASTHP